MQKRVTISVCKHKQEYKNKTKEQTNKQKRNKEKNTHAVIAEIAAFLRKKNTKSYKLAPPCVWILSFKKKVIHVFV